MYISTKSWAYQVLLLWWTVDIEPINTLFIFLWVNWPIHRNVVMMHSVRMLPITDAKQGSAPSSRIEVRELSPMAHLRGLELHVVSSRTPVWCNSQRSGDGNSNFRNNSRSFTIRSGCKKFDLSPESPANLFLHLILKLIHYSCAKCIAQSFPRLTSVNNFISANSSYLPWQCLYFLPEPQGQGSLRPTLCPAGTGAFCGLGTSRLSRLTLKIIWEMSCLMPAMRLSK